MKTFKLSKVFKKFLGGGASVALAAGAVQLAKSKAGIEFSPTIEVTIVIPLLAGLIKAGNNFLKHKVGIDILGILGEIIIKKK